MDDKLKHLRSVLDTTIFKDDHFTKENESAVFEKINKQPSKKRSFDSMGKVGKWLKPALSTAFCLMLVACTFFLVNQKLHSSPTPGSNNQASNVLNKRGNHQTFGAFNRSSSSSHSSSSSTAASNSTTANSSSSSTTASIKLKDTSTITTVRLADPTTGWVGGKGWIAKTTDGGHSWQTQFKDPNQETVHQLFALNHQQVWATLETGTSPSSNLNLIQSLDGGQTWSTIGVVPTNSFLHFNTPNLGFSGNAETTNGGQSWMTLPIPTNTVGNAYFHDQKNGWAVTHGTNNLLHVMRTTDGGQSWQTVMSRKTISTLTNAVIRSAGSNDAWIEMIGESGMSQTSYSLFHTTDGGKHWITVLNNSTAGAGPAPGFPMNNLASPHNNGVSPGALYVANTKVAFMGGQCEPCNNQNTIGWTKDGGKTWVNGSVSFKGSGPQYLAIANANNGWWITTEMNQPSVMYTTSDGGITWTKVHTFH